MPAAEREEVRQIYRAWGLEGEALEEVVRQVTANEETWLQVMMADELKLQPVDEQRVLRSALVVGLAAIIGSLVPLIPFFFLASGLFSRSLAVGISLAMSAVALFLVGVYKARQTVGRPGRSGLQMTVIGIASALAGYGIGTLFGG
ncbi:MAG TPA: VIT1/CCC1 transporter family protein [Anaerolineae bacterium]|nr:VIT1/CCC1 transporter family protein [Anaerolineae bacterium]